ncbi:hypothetical protein [Mycolicibacterium mengxianglii]|uniref:hypothetical protein n=1 Tax=Mycolicibacterium mengxianglii TaxID=2736649 RepID=UPI0018D08AAA|nr:hypothetical protein [Mycolicibacterium mengxianglii]
MLSRVLIAVAAAGAAVVGPAGAASAEPAPPPPPPPPNINGYAMAVPSDYQVADGLYAFSTPLGLTCIVSRGAGAYGCNGPLPGAPNGANLITGGPGGMPGFASSDRPLFVSDKPVKPLPANTRISYSTISCGVDEAGAAICTNSFDQTGFVLGPTTSWNFGAVNPLVDRPEGTNPYAN